MGKSEASVVKDLIVFHAKENPSWRKNDKCSVKTMLKKIVEFQKRWESEKDKFEASVIRKVNRKFYIRFIFHVNYEEEHGCDTYEETENCLEKVHRELRRGISMEERETINLSNAYKYLAEVAENENDPETNGLLLDSILQDAHKLILEDIKLPRGATEPGKFSDRPRFTEFHGEKYEYPTPEDMHQTVITLLDRHNSLLSSAKSETDDITRVYNLFKTCAVLLFELLDLHPFSDGNGRLCRLLCSYCLSVCTPFPTPIYNVWSDSSKDDYKQALVDARKSGTRYPESLTTMIIECNYLGWETYFEELEKSS